MNNAVEGHKRTRRTDKAQQTHQRIVDAATRLFLERGYVATTIDAIAQAADVAVETVYARSRTKTNLMVAVKDAAVTEGGQVPLRQRPELPPSPPKPASAGSCRSRPPFPPDARTNLAGIRAAPRCSRSRRHPQGAPTAEIDRRRDFQKTLLDLVRAHGPLRDSLTPSQAADTYSALASPELYLLLTTHHGWTPGQFQTWLADSLQRLLLPQALNSRAPGDPRQRSPRSSESGDSPNT